MWYTNLYYIQKSNVNDNQSGPTIFLNGIYFSALDSISLVVGGHIGKVYMVFNAYLIQIGLSSLLMIFRLVFIN